MAQPSSRWSATASPIADTADHLGLACRAVATPGERAAHFRIRHQVFVVEQGLFRCGGGDRDAHDDEPATIHVIGLADGVICGTVRLYPMPAVAGRWKGDRLAVLAGHRHQGLGAPLVRFAVAAAALHCGLEMEAYIQPANVTFFERLGWRRAGGPVDYAGIPHQRMLIVLGAPPLSAEPPAGACSGTVRQAGFSRRQAAGTSPAGAPPAAPGS
jgi:putative N-acetyltransferase (TIGR04045 family)